MQKIFEHAHNGNIMSIFQQIKRNTQHIYAKKFLESNGTSFIVRA